jgi:hypothetical protein
VTPPMAPPVKTFWVVVQPARPAERATTANAATSRLLKKGVAAPLDE